MDEPQHQPPPPPSEDPHYDAPRGGHDDRSMRADDGMHEERRHRRSLSRERRGSRHSRSRSRDRGSRRHRRDSRDRGDRYGDRSRSRDRGHRRFYDEYEGRGGRRHRDRSPPRGRLTADDRRRAHEESTYKSTRLWPSTAWDEAPFGYEHMTPQQYKEALASNTLPPPLYTGDSDEALLNVPLPTRQLVVENLPEGTRDHDLMSFMNDCIASNKLITQPGQPVIKCTLSEDGKSAVLEFRSVDEATNGLVFDRERFKGAQLRVRRPDNYEAPKGHITRIPMQSGANVSAVVQDSPYKIYIGGIPPYLSEEQVKELLEPFGQLKSFHLVMDTSTGQSKGFAFCEYMDPAITDTMIGALNDLRIGEKRLLVQRASIGARGGAQQNNPMHSIPAFKSAGMQGPGGPMMPLPPMSAPLKPAAPGAPITPGPISQPPPMSLPLPPPSGAGLPLPAPTMPTQQLVATRILILMNMVTVDELRDDEEYEDICADIREECEKFGEILDMKIPRPSKENPEEQVPGVGKIYLKYASADEARIAARALSGRSFAERTVVTSFWPEDKFDAGTFEE